MFPHHKVDEQPNKKPKKGDYSHKRRESDNKNAVAIVKIVPQLGCVSQDSEAFAGKTDAKSLGTDSKSTIHSVYATSSKGPSLGQKEVTHPHQRSPYAMKREDWSHGETDRQQRCARGKAWNLAKNIYKLKDKDKATFYSPSEEWVLSAASTKEPCIWSVRKTFTLLSWRP